MDGIAKNDNKSMRYAGKQVGYLIAKQIKRDHGYGSAQWKGRKT